MGGAYRASLKRPEDLPTVIRRLAGLVGKEASKKSWVKSTREKARCWWLTPAILAIWEAEIRRIAVQ
jgi:hypothetical protein